MIRLFETEARTFTAMCTSSTARTHGKECDYTDVCNYDSLETTYALISKNNDSMQQCLTAYIKGSKQISISNSYEHLKSH